MTSVARKLRFLLFLVILPLAVPVSAQSLKPRTVLDYYKLLPERLFEADRVQRINFMLDPKRGAIVDSRRGYLFAPGDGAQTDIYVALFKKRSRDHLVAVKYHEVDTQDITRLEFYVYQNNSWSDVSQSVLPVKINDELKYELPRFGRTIKIRDKHGKRLYSLIWFGQKFGLRR